MRHLPIYLGLGLIMVSVATPLMLLFCRYIPKDNTLAFLGASFLSIVIAAFVVAFAFKFLDRRHKH